MIDDWNDPVYAAEYERKEGYRAGYAAALEDAARVFHDNYERLAPKFAYNTREETRRFDPESPNGELMVATCDAVLALLRGENK